MVLLVWFGLGCVVSFVCSLACLLTKPYDPLGGKLNTDILVYSVGWFVGLQHPLPYKRMLVGLVDLVGLV